MLHTVFLDMAANDRSRTRPFCSEGEKAMDQPDRSSSSAEQDTLLRESSKVTRNDEGVIFELETYMGNGERS